MTPKLLNHSPNKSPAVCLEENKPVAESIKVLLVEDDEDDYILLKSLIAEPSAAGELARHRQLLAEWRRTTDEEKYPVAARR